MGNYTFSLDDVVMAKFRQKSMGEMSTILNQLLANYLEVESSVENSAKIKEELEKIRYTRKELVAKEIDLNRRLQLIEKEDTNKKVATISQETELRNDAKDYIQFMKQQKKLSELVLEAEKAGYSEQSLEEYLIQLFKKQKEAYNG